MRDAPILRAVEFAALWPLRKLLRALPHGASRALGGWLGELAHAFDSSGRATARENVAGAYPELDPSERARIARAGFRHFGAAFFDALSAVRFDRVELCHRVTIVGLEHLVAAEAGGRGVVLLTARLGNWEIVPLAISLARGPVALIHRPVDDPHVDRELCALHDRFGNRMLDERGAVRELFRVLRAKGLVGLLVEQGVRAEEAIEVPFLGRPARTRPIVARLALESGAPVVLVFAGPLPGGRYRVEFHPAIEPGGPDDEANTLELTRRCLEACERVIRRSPEHWLWFQGRRRRG